MIGHFFLKQSLQFCLTSCTVQQTYQHNDEPEQPSSGEVCEREHVGQHVDGRTACRNKGSREATPESHGVPWRTAHGVP